MNDSILLLDNNEAKSLLDMSELIGWHLPPAENHERVAAGGGDGQAVRIDSDLFR